MAEIDWEDLYQKSLKKTQEMAAGGDFSESLFSSGELDAAKELDWRAVDEALAGQKEALGRQKEERLQAYRDAAQEAYIQYMLQKRDLGQALQAGGLGGGLSETAAASLEASLGGGQLQLRKQFERAAEGIDSQIGEAERSALTEKMKLEADYKRLLAEAQAELQRLRYEKQLEYELSRALESAAAPRYTYAYAQEEPIATTDRRGGSSSSSSSAKKSSVGSYAGGAAYPWQAGGGAGNSF